MTQVQERAATQPADEQDRLGLPQSTALVMGSIIGVGIFSLPYAIASYGPISLVAMVVATIGAGALAMLFAVMSRRLPADGGPYAYARVAFGNGLGFSNAWAHWMREHTDKPDDEITFAFVGDAADDTANSLLVPGAMLGMDVRIVSPASLATPEDVVKAARTIADETGARLEVGEELYRQTGLTALEVTDEVFESAASIVFDQAENRLHTIKAVLVATLGGPR